MFQSSLTKNMASQQQQQTLLLRAHSKLLTDSVHLYWCVFLILSIIIMFYWCWSVSLCLSLCLCLNLPRFSRRPVWLHSLFLFPMHIPLWEVALKRHRAWENGAAEVFHSTRTAEIIQTRDADTLWNLFKSWVLHAK